MRQLHKVLPLLALALLLGTTPRLAADEIDPADFDALTAIGTEAKEKMIELVTSYEATMTNVLRSLVQNASHKSDPDSWEVAVREMLDERIAWRGTAFDMYCGWAEDKGADRSKIEDFPSDWVRMEADYGRFFDAAAREGLVAYAGLVELLKDADDMNGFVWTDGLRIDDAVLIATEAEHDMAAAASTMQLYKDGKQDIKQTQNDLRVYRDRLNRWAVAWSNRVAVLDDIVKRVKEKTTGDNAAEKRVGAVKNAFAAFTKAVEAHDTDLRFSTEAAGYEQLIETHCEFFEKMQEDWLKRVDPIVQGTLFKDLGQLGGSHSTALDKMKARLAEIDKVLKK